MSKSESCSSYEATPKADKNSQLWFGPLNSAHYYINECVRKEHTTINGAWAYCVWYSKYVLWDTARHLLMSWLGVPGVLTEQKTLKRYKAQGAP